MWVAKSGPCKCFFCLNDKPHPARHTRWTRRGHLQVAESLDPADVLHTRICSTCTHEEALDGQKES